MVAPLEIVVRGLFIGGKFIDWPKTSECLNLFVDLSRLLDNAYPAGV